MTVSVAGASDLAASWRTVAWKGRRTQATSARGTFRAIAAAHYRAGHWRPQGDTIVCFVVPPRCHEGDPGYSTRALLAGVGRAISCTRPLRCPCSQGCSTLDTL